tara:strand:- start:82 stop:1239 length:1158 start_codon:yes stop_codon:yes gene_type:complete
MNRTEPTKPNGKDRTVAQVIVTPTSSTQGWSLETAKTRINYDPVLDIDVTEYQIPYNKVTIDKKSQNRDTGTPQSKQSSLAHDMNTKGQKTGVKVAIGEDGDFPLRWGNTRRGGAGKLYRNEDNLDRQFCVIKNCDEGMIWASIWDGKDRDLRRMQARENNLHDPTTPANIHDNIRSMKDIIDDGHLDYGGKRYDECDDEEKRVRMQKEVNETMPPFAGKKFKGFFNKFRKTIKSGFQVHSKDMKQMQDHFVKSNPLGITSMNEALTGYGHHFEVEYDIIGNKLPAPERVKIIFPNNGTDKGSIFQQAFAAKYVYKTADKVYSVVAVNPSQSKLLTKFRDNDIAVQEEWNRALPGSETFTDGSMYMPQCDPEDNSPNHWAKVVKF